MDRHPPWRAMLPLAHLQRELRDLPTRHAEDPETHCHSGRVFGVLSRAVSESELVAWHPARVNRERPSGLKLRAPPILPVYQAGSALS